MAEELIVQLTADIDLAISTLKSGGVIVYPTETSYGIGCDATNADVVAKVFEVKQRKEGKGAGMLLPNGQTPDQYGLDFPEPMKELAKKHWPGPLTIVCQLRGETPLSSSSFTPGERAFRRSSHPIANALVDALGVPLVSTSANISGEPELYSAKEIYDRFSRESIQPDVIIDAGELPKRAPSTLITWDDARGAVKVLRQGEITV